jgi:hypothetical protein
MPFDIEAARSRLASLERSNPGRLRDTIAALSRPRLSGSEEALAVEHELRERFEELGYRTEELPFSFSTWPGRFGMSVAGGVLVLAAVLGPSVLLAGLPGVALVVFLLAGGLALAPLLALDPALRKVPWGRTEARNLLFRRPESRPAWILMTHRDSKSQIVPTALRTVAVALGGMALLALILLSMLWVLGEDFRFAGLTVVAGMVLFGVGVLLILSWAANESPGALDNASGLAALLEVAADNTAGDVAFLLTDAEELGLVGARFAVDALPPVQGVINVDGLDDHGPFHVSEGHGWKRKGSAPQLAAALLTAAAVLDLPVQRRRLSRSLQVDHLPVAAAGIPALTVLRGDWQSLLRVHSPRDDVARIDGTGAADGATLLRAAVRLLREEAAAHLAGRRVTGA